MGPNQILDKGLVPTTAVPIYSVVKLTDVEECAITDTAGEAWVGVMQEEIDADDVDNGRHARVRVEGFTYAVAGTGDVALNARVAAADDGTVVTAVATNHVVGIARTAGAAGEWVVVQLTPGIVEA